LKNFLISIYLAEITNVQTQEAIVTYQQAGSYSFVYGQPEQPKRSLPIITRTVAYKAPPHEKGNLS